jgi:SNF2 family DNA or RNA helicase
MAEELTEERKQFFKKIKKAREKDFSDLKIDGLKIDLYPFQKNNVVSMAMVNGHLLSDATGLGKTVSTIGLMCFLRQRGYKGKWIILAYPSATRQWVEEIHKFSDLKAMYVVNKTSDHRYAYRGKEARLAQYEKFMESDCDVLVITYYNLIHDGLEKKKVEYEDDKGKIRTRKELYLGPLLKMFKDQEISVVFDEAQAMKTVDPEPSQTHIACKLLANMCEFKYGLTATPITNNLIDLYAIYSVISPGYLGKLYNFKNDYCDYVMIRLKTGRRFPKLNGYKNLDQLKRIIYPIYFCHRKTDVEDQLPTLIQKVVSLELTRKQQEVYDLIVNEAVEDLEKLQNEAAEFLGMSLDEDSVSMNIKHVLSKMTRLQQAGNSLELLPLITNSTDSVKIDELIRALNGDLEGEKVVIFSKSKEMINLVEKRLIKEKIKCVRITGDEKTEDQKHHSMKLFQTDPDVKVCLITQAGSASINLQVAPYLICLDLPWSLGTLVQLIGRIHRFGSDHDSVVVLFYLVEGTIDYLIWEVLQGKKDLADFMVGGTDIGDLDESTAVKPEDFLKYIKSVR